MQFIQFICRRISAIKQSTFLRCSSMCILPCFHLAMSNPLRGSNHDKPRERERESKLSACWKYKALSLWYIHLSEKIKRLTISHAPPKKILHSHGWEVWGTKPWHFSQLFKSWWGWFAILRLIFSTKRWDSAWIEGEKHSQNIQRSCSPWSWYPSVWKSFCHNNSAQMQLELGDQVLSHLAKYHELKNHVGARKDANELQLVLLQIALGALAWVSTSLFQSSLIWVTHFVVKVKISNAWNVSCHFQSSTEFRYMYDFKFSVS